MSAYLADGVLYISSGDVAATMLALRDIGFNLPSRFSGDYAIVRFQPTPLAVAATVDFQGFPGVSRTELHIQYPQSA